MLAALLLAGACWLPPVDAPVADPFRPPACAWCPGNRGIEYATPAGTEIRAAATGRVTFAGTVAHRHYVVVMHPTGHRVTYGKLRPTGWRAGDVVVAGAVVGRAAGPFHLGVRAGETYFDPAPFLGRLVHRPRLIPADGSAAPPAPPALLRCD